MTTLSDELNNLRNNICHDCKKKFVPDIVSAAAPSNGLNSSVATSSKSAFWRRMFKGRLPSIDNTAYGYTSDSAVSNSLTTVPLSTSETLPDTPVDTFAPNTGPKQTSELKPELSEFLIEYNPEVKRALDIRLVHVFTHESPIFSMKISPDGQKIAVGIAGAGKAIINEVKTKSNVRSVSEALVSNLD